MVVVGGRGLDQMELAAVMMTKNLSVREVNSSFNTTIRVM